jgi:hypothetical protein
LSAQAAYVVGSDLQDDFPVWVAQDFLRDEMQRVTVFVRLLMNVVSIIAENIQKMVVVDSDSHPFFHPLAVVLYQAHPFTNYLPKAPLTPFPDLC